MELKKLKLKLDALDMAVSVEKSVNSYLSIKGLNQLPQANKWAFNVLACSVTDEEYSKMSSTWGLHRTCCNTQ